MRWIRAILNGIGMIIGMIAGPLGLILGVLALLGALAAFFYILFTLV